MSEKVGKQAHHNQDCQRTVHGVVSVCCVLYENIVSGRFYAVAEFKQALIPMMARKLMIYTYVDISILLYLHSFVWSFDFIDSVCSWHLYLTYQLLHKQAKRPFNRLLNKLPLSCLFVILTGINIDLPTYPHISNVLTVIALFLCVSSIFLKARILF